MIWQWVIISIAVGLATLYLFKAVRRTMRRPFCSDCPGCSPRKLTTRKS